jgi:2-C-methyl-D-erythritol 4-phosphate cytidylyltransferase
MNYSVIIVAAGSGSRMNLGFNKVYFPLNDKEMIIDRTLNVFRNDKNCKQIILVTNKEYFIKFADQHGGTFTLVDGGATRSESVCNGLHCVLEDYVYIHDGARPYVTLDALNRLNKRLEIDDACMLAVKSIDTIKHVEDGYVVKTVDRNKLYKAQTPQAFKTSLLLNVYNQARRAGTICTDDASVVERFSDVKVRIVEGEYSNIKITTKDDIK